MAVGDVSALLIMLIYNLQDLVTVSETHEVTNLNLTIISKNSC